MIIVKVDKGIEKALKEYKAKHRKTDLYGELRKRKEFTKNSVKIRQQKMKAIYIQKIKSNEK